MFVRHRLPVHLLAHIYASVYVRHMAVAMEVLVAIAEPSRQRILEVVRDRDCSVNELVEHLGLPQPGVSRHLRVLRDAGLVEVTKDAQRRIYRLRPEPFAELDAWLAPYRRHWAERLDALEDHLARSATPIPKEHS